MAASCATNNVEDAAIVLQAPAGHDRHDPLSADKPVGNYGDSIRRISKIAALGFYAGPGNSTQGDLSAAVGI
jgi:Asp-tRNA(Asn)/Glu-tRNA(Gln) amidotransferase A subunit family amidase